MKKSCDTCQKKTHPNFGVCKTLREEMARRDYWVKDIIRELEKLKRELAKECSDYKEEGDASSQ